MRSSDALTLTPQSLPDFNGDDRFALVANLPYNVATPIVLTLLERFANLDTFLVMVQKEVADRLAAQPGTKIYGTPSVKLAWYQKEVADRLAAQPGTKIYGTPSVKLAWYGTAQTVGAVKLAWYGTAQTVGAIGRNVFWPAPNVDSALVLFRRHPAGAAPADRAGVSRETVFRLVDAAFGQRRKTLHAALIVLFRRHPAGAAPADRAGVSRETVFRLVDAAFGQRRKTLHAALKTSVPPEASDRAGLDATRRGETLSIDEFVQLAAALEGARA